MGVTQAMAIGGITEDSIQSVTPTSDGGYIVGGYFESGSIKVGDYTLKNNSGAEDGMIIK